MCIFSLICWTDWWTSEGYIRENKKVIIKSPFIKKMLGFSEWVIEVDISSIILNIKNEIIGIALIVGWFVLDFSTKEYVTNKLSLGVLLLADMFIEVLVWPILLVRQIDKEKKYTVSMRETFDLCEREGEITCDDDKMCIYRYAYTYSKKGDMPNKVIIFPPSTYLRFIDVNGNGYGSSEKGEYRMSTNLGAYQELSDCLVRAGYATLRLEGKRQLGAHGANAKMLSEFFLKILEQQSFHGEIFLFAHGYVNWDLSSYCEKMDLRGIISMCGAAIGFEEAEIRKMMWNGKSKKKALKVYNKIKEKVLREKEESINLEALHMKREDWIRKFFEVASQVPILVGYVSQDPYYSPEIAEEIKERKNEKVEVVKFERTDFTLRKCNVNRKINALGYLLDEKEKIPPMNPEVAEEIIKWMGKF